MAARAPGSSSCSTACCTPSTAVLGRKYALRHVPFAPRRSPPHSLCHAVCHTRTVPMSWQRWVLGGGGGCWQEGVFLARKGANCLRRSGIGWPQLLEAALLEAKAAVEEVQAENHVLQLEAVELREQARGHGAVVQKLQDDLRFRAGTAMDEAAALKVRPPPPTPPTPPSPPARTPRLSGDTLKLCIKCWRPHVLPMTVSAEGISLMAILRAHSDAAHALVPGQTGRVPWSEG